MNRSGIEWCDHTWNPVTGCRHNCSYCYARRMTVRFAGDVRLNKMAKKDYKLEPAADKGEDLYVLDAPLLNETGNPLAYPFGFEPTLHRYRMDMLDKLKMGNNIFVGAMADVFGTWVPDSWLDDIFAACEKRPIHNYLFLTKNAERFTEYRVPAGLENMWYGTSITRENEVDRFNLLPAGCRTFVSIEPLLEDIDPEKHNIMFRQIDWIIIGAETGRNKEKVVPAIDWIRKIVNEADQTGIPVFMKDSLLPIVGAGNIRREYPKGLMRKAVSPKMEKKLYDSCISCKVHMKKRMMMALYARSKRGEQPKQFGFMCRECFQKFCEDYSVETPAFARLSEHDMTGTEDTQLRKG